MYRVIRSVFSFLQSKKNGLAFQLSVPFVLFLVILGMAFTVMLFLSSVAEKKELERAPQVAARLARDSLELYFQGTITSLTTAALGYQAGFSEGDLTQFLSILVHENQDIVQVSLLSQGGAVLSRETEPGFSPVETPFEYAEGARVSATHSNNPTVTEPYKNVEGGSFLTLYVPVFSSTSSAPSFVFEAILDTRTLSKNVTRVSFESDAAIYVVDDTGMLLLSSTDITSESITQTKSAWKILSQQGWTQHYESLMGSHVVGSLQKVPTARWNVIAEIERDTLVSSIQQNLLMLFLFVLGIVCVMYSYLHTFRSQLLAPLSEFKVYGEQMVKGVYSARVNITPENELRRVGAVMNLMAENVEKQTSTIVEKLRITLSTVEKNAKVPIRRDLELSEANEKLRSLDKAKSEFVSIAAHQLRTPLSAIKWAQQMVIDGELGALNTEQATVLHQSQESVTRMVTLVNDLLSADHLEFDKVHYTFTEVNLKKILEKVKEDFQSLADERAITLTCGGEDATTMGDAQRLNEAVCNLFNNAVKYTPMKGRVTAVLSTTETHATITLTDTGIGIPKSEQHRLFEKFVRIDNAKKVDANGSGLGLFIVKKIIDAHHGKIWFTSNEGRGTEFVIELPRVQLEKEH